MNTSIDKIRKDIGLLYFTAICVHVRVSENLENMDLKKKNGAARLDPWEIFVLLPLKIPFHFISLRKLTNYFQLYKRNALNLNRTKKS